MKSSCNDDIRNINCRIDELYKLMQMILISNLVDDAEQLVKNKNIILCGEANNIIEENYLVFRGIEIINDIEVLLIEIPEELKTKTNIFKRVYCELKKIYPEKEPMLIFKSINGMQKKKIIQENISYSIRGKEMYLKFHGGVK